jgi:hypothetical protein
MESRKQSTLGEMTNLMQVNTESFVDFLWQGNYLWSAPFEIIIALIILWFYIGIKIFFIKQVIRR